VSVPASMKRLTLAFSLAALSHAALAPPTHAGQAPTTVTFSYTGTTSSWVVPAGVTRISAEVFGAQGGGGPFAPNYGGLGGKALATLTVSPGETLAIRVGGRGGNGGVPTGPSARGTQGSGGFNGGGDGGAEILSDGAGGGGGASDIRRAPFDLSSRVLLAGGGGGAGSGAQFAGHNVNVRGGDGGGLLGEPGEAGTGPPGVPGAGGGGASSTTAGAGGAGGLPPYGLSGSGGTLGAGGSGGGGIVLGGSGGGGGGGLFGGGGGGGGADFDGGGGGGGGGSGFGPPGVGLTAGVRAGDGLVTISYTVDAFASLASLTREYVRHEGLAQAMVQLLNAARRSDEHGIQRAKAAQVGAYIRLVNTAQRIGVLSTEHAATLTKLANEL
jgi:hypothetical protein